MPETLYPPRRYEFGPKRSEIQVLQTAHKFLRPEGEDPRKLDWNDALAHKYYSSLYREYAICDLKHFKSGNIGLRWRTEDEVISGIGETTCGNPRCKHHEPDSRAATTSPSTRRWDDESEVGESSKSKRCKEKKLVTLELPFSYEEHDEQKTALVKVALCERCVKKLNWKREKERVRSGDLDEETTPSRSKKNSTRRSRSRSPNGRDSGDPTRSKGLDRDGETARRSRPSR